MQFFHLDMIGTRQDLAIKAGQDGRLCDSYEEAQLRERIRACIPVHNSLNRNIINGKSPSVLVGACFGYDRLA